MAESRFVLTLNEKLKEFDIFEKLDSKMRQNSDDNNNILELSDS